MASNTEKEDEVEREERDARLGRSRHTFRTGVRRSSAPKRALEVSGAAGAVLVPIGAAIIEGVLGIVVAVFGGLVAVAAYVLSARQRKKPPSTKIEVFERGIVCSSGKASRELVWNEVVDIACKKMPMPDGTPAVALVFETVVDPPLLIMVGGKFSTESETAKLLDSLGEVWIPVWCRRARVLAQQAQGVRVGGALLRCECVVVGDEKLAWTAIRGIHSVDGVERLETTDGFRSVEGTTVTTPFPSAARRIVALAESPPAPPLLPPLPPVTPARRK